MPEQPKQSALQSLRNWGENSVPPTLLATLITAQHARPFQVFPMMFPPVLLFSSYLNLSNYKTDSAGITAAWSGLYALLAMRRRQGIKNKLTVRGVVRGASLALCAVNVVGGGLAYTFGKREKEEKKV
ncbi:Altered inheritance of mitochondria 19 [Pyrenophora seminiperda CCB06]|uniref:Altered inheritance of mitochondria 19 n=1 Tax=Pyrenophora seminiperda CCB06 TaxID=1302712 RepID=A0A3M7LUZ4_9PLEO|nr:Altered inheritance of mitochondria 19 [Pyrenophora seminiperda CCB06]